MTPKTLLRLASVCLLVHFAGHIAGHSMWDKPEDARLAAVVAQMKAHSAPFMGAVKSMADHYDAFSLMMVFVYGLSACILWFAAAVMSLKQARYGIVLPLAVTYLCFGAIEYQGFFPFAAAMSFTAGGLTLAAVLRSTRQPADR